jgi:NADPH2:quinone reductase
MGRKITILGGSMATRIEFHKHGGPGTASGGVYPTDPAENEVQVENKAIGINYIDTYIRSGLYPPRHCRAAWAPRRRAWSAKWAGVKHIKAGDRVVYAQSGLGAYSSVHNVLADKAAFCPMPSRSSRRRPRS